MLFGPHGRMVRSSQATWLLLLLAVLAFALTAQARADAPDYPPLSGRVVDEAGILSPGERASLDQTLADHEQRTGQQVVVVTLASLRGRTIEEYGYQLGRHWGIGEKDKNTGALFIIAPKERKLRIEVGYGLEGVLTDAASRIILETIVLPAFRSGQMGPGIVAGTGAILQTIVGEAPERPAAKPKKSDDISPLTIFFIFIVCLFVAYAFSRGARSMPGGYYDSRMRRGRGGAMGPIVGGRGGGLGGGVGGGVGGGWGGGSDGGGFSGGGGSFGGGGASSDW